MKKSTVISLVASFLITSAPFVYSATPTPAPTPVDTMIKKVEYILPYPGILPDHPLYVLKVIRDRILDALIVDPLRKAEFYILQADKRLNMAIFLGEKGSWQLAEQTVSKGEKYMDGAVGIVTSVKGTGRDVPGYLIDRIEKSTAKHMETLSELIPKAPEPQNGGLNESLNLVKKLQQEVMKIK